MIPAPVEYAAPQDTQGGWARRPLSVLTVGFVYKIAVSRRTHQLQPQTMAELNRVLRFYTISVKLCCKLNSSAYWSVTASYGT